MHNPKIKLFDAHLHIIDTRFPLIQNQGFLPDEFTCSHYLAQVEPYDLVGGAVVSGSFQGFDQAYLLEALKQLGPLFVGVTQLPVTTSDKELIALQNSGIRAVRFNLKRGGSEDIKHLKSFAARIHELVGWHVELYIDSKELADIYDALVTLPAVSVDHLGLSKAGFGTLLKLAEHGIGVKATGFGRVDFDVRSALIDLFNANPAALMFGTDLPSTRAPRPFLHDDCELIRDALGEQSAQRVFFENARTFYRQS